MVEFPFDATRYKPWDGNESPAEYAFRAWHAPSEELDLETACAMASTDLQVYNELWEWAIKGTAPHEAKLMLFDALVRPKPRKKDNLRRDMRLRAIAEVLRQRYALPLTSEGGILDILNDLPGTPERDRLLSIVGNRG